MSAVIRVRCPACRTLLKVRADRIDQPIRCSKCNKSFRAKPKTEPPPAKDPSTSETQPAPMASPALTPADQPVTPRPERSEGGASSAPLATLASRRHANKPPGRVRRVVALGLLFVVIAVGGFFYREVLEG